MIIYAFRLVYQFKNGRSHNSNVSHEIWDSQSDAEEDPYRMKYVAISKGKWLGVYCQCRKKEIAFA
jgi:hypothetical protein